MSADTPERPAHHTPRGFRNLVATSMLLPGAWPRMIWQQLAGREQRRPPAALPTAWPGPGAHAAPPASGLRVTWLGHSSLLLELGQAVIVTDPVWSEWASPLARVGPRRFHPPPIPLAELPRPQLALISHNHYDHLDRAAIRQLDHAGLEFVVPLGVGRHLRRWGVAARRIQELDWWRGCAVPGADLQVTALPARHYSGRGLRDRDRALWASWALRGAGQSVYVGCDSGMLPAFAEIGERCGPFDLATLPIGQYHATWPDIHLHPEQAAEAARLLRARAVLPVHWATFALAMHAWDEPIERLLAAAGPETAILTPRLGEPIEPAGAATGAWWRP